MAHILLRGVVVASIAIVVMIGPVALAEPSDRQSHLPIVLAPTQSTTVTVAGGDHLWKLSEARLFEVLGREPEDSEVSPYWRTVIEANRDRLRSGDPNLIYPGEEVVLPTAG